ncbi:MAG: tyrosine-type recombinase/integrase [Candidatus Eisenbacteria bacterium]
MRFSDIGIRNLRPGPKRYEKWESRGFGIRVGVSGKKTWIMVYRLRKGGKQTWLPLGTFPALSLGKARLRHARGLEALEAGQDPAVVLAQPTEGISFEKLRSQYLELYARPRKRSWRQDEALLRRETPPGWQARPASSITGREIVALLDAIVGRGSPVTANRTLAVLRRMYSWAAAPGRELVPHSPCVGVETPAQRRTRDRALASRELSALVPMLRQAPAYDRPSQALLAILLTGARPGEIATMRVRDVDRASRTWLIPAERTKGNREHLVPLSRQALEVIEAAAASYPGPWVFGSDRRRGQPYSRVAIARRMRELCARLNLERATPHDLRRTAATGCASLGTPRVVVRRILGHADPSVTGIYDRHEYEAEMRAALEAWARRLDELGRGV